MDRCQVEGCTKTVSRAGHELCLDHYRERQTAKRAIYAKHGLQLIELGDAELERLDDVLTRMLLRFGIESA